MSQKSSKGLGRGLSALIADANETAMPQRGQNFTPANDSNLIAIKLPVDHLKPSKFQPRSYFNTEDLADLAESIRKNGVVQPVIVRAVRGRDSENPEVTHELIAGERRWRAAGMANLSDIPAIVMELDDKQVLEVALIENIQRQNLTPLEVADGYQRLIKEFEYTQEELSEVIGKSRAQITNFLRLLTLPESVKTLLNQEKISVGHARALLGAPDAESVAEKIVSRGLNVRQTEKLIQNTEKVTTSQGKKKAPISSAVQALRREGEETSPNRKMLEEFSKLYEEIGMAQRDPDILELEKVLSKNLGMQLRIVDEGEKGKIIISYHAIEELDTILRKLERVAVIA